MKAVLHTGAHLPWLPDPEDRPWMMLPVGNRPLLEYWVECCVDLGIREIRLVLGSGGYLIEKYAGEGERWGVQITYSFQKPGEDPDTFLQRDTALWKDGLLYLRHPCFPLRRQPEIRPPGAGAGCDLGTGESEFGFYSEDPATLEAFLQGKGTGPLSANTAGFSAYALEKVKNYFDLNMRMIQGEIVNYLAPGYELREGSHIGYNVVIPPSVIMEAPVMIGNDVRLSPLDAVGPHAVIGNSVVIDAQTELRNCVILDGSYIGRNLSIEEKIVAGNLLIDPVSGESFRLEDPLLLGDVGIATPLTDMTRNVADKIFALLLWLFLLPGFACFYSLISISHAGKYRQKSVLDAKGVPRMCPEFLPVKHNFLTGCFQGLSLDRWPLMGWVLLNRFFLCGHAPLSPEAAAERKEKIPQYFPGVFYDELLLPQPVPPVILNVYALNFIHNRHLTAEIGLFFRVWMHRLLKRLTVGEEI